MSALLDQRLENASIALVVSSSSESYGLLRARRNGVPTLVLDKKMDWGKLTQDLNDRGITHIFLVGFMKVIPQSFLEAWKKPILNVHPSLLPTYPGLASIRRAYEEKNPVGVTVHRVIAEVDAGAHVAQREVVNSVEILRKSLCEVESLVHLTEYDLIRKSIKVASCWT